METKQCKKCGEVKPVTEFYMAGIQNGVQQHRAQCAACTLTPRTAERWALREQGLKKCTRCGRVLPLDDFYEDKRKSDGRRDACKPCHIEATAVYQQTNGHTKLLAAKRARNHRPDVKRKRAEYMRKQRASAVWANQESARRAVGVAVASGAMPPARNVQCADCGGKAQEYHHESYERDRWLDVAPLCTNCHNKRHAVNA